MKLGILYDRIRKDEKLIIEKPKQNNINVELVNANFLIFALEKNGFKYDLV